jgi:hypothetical protein
MGGVLLDATICHDDGTRWQMGGNCSLEASETTYPGLSQGSPLSPIIYIFFNAGLVEETIKEEQGALNFMDNDTR